jgi:hypothetical protein
LSSEYIIIFTTYSDYLRRKIHDDCVAKWVRSRASGFMHHESESLGSIPGVGTVNQAVHPSGIGELVVVIEQWVTTAED